jgi:formylglycine-generating enzyme required for sulfatase activity
MSSRILLVSLLAFSCDRPAPKYANVDEPDPIPQPKAPGPPKVEEPKKDPAGNELDGKCTRGTGRNEAGECVTLATRQTEHVQQLQIPAGVFVVGDAPSNYDFEKTRTKPAILWAGQPPRAARSEGFWIDLHEVTRGAYEACVKSGKCTAPACDPSETIAKLPPESLPNTPQTCVTHEQAETYCKTQGGRLPTEVEWEYAARGVDARLYPWGSEMRDEYMAGLLSVMVQLEVGYFGIRGQGSNATEWVADVYDREAPVAAYLAGTFRSPDGPLAKVGPAPKGHVFKSARVGDRYVETDADPMLGFRCAADLQYAPGGDVVPLQVPATAPALPVFRPIGELKLFGGIAEAVSLDEAKAFCEAVAIELEGQKFVDWRLPSLAEVTAIAEGFRGPGPFWTASDGPIAQKGAGSSPGPEVPWESLGTAESVKGQAFAARCVHE